MLSLFIFSWFLIIKISAKEINILDALAVSIVLIVPSAFVLFENQFTQFAQFIGIEFPFVLMFGLILFWVYLIILRILTRVQSAESKLKFLTQLVALNGLDVSSKNDTSDSQKQ